MIVSFDPCCLKKSTNKNQPIKKFIRVVPKVAKQINESAIIFIFYWQGS